MAWEDRRRRAEPRVTAANCRAAAVGAPAASLAQVGRQAAVVRVLAAARPAQEARQPVAAPLRRAGRPAPAAAPGRVAQPSQAAQPTRVARPVRVARRVRVVARNAAGRPAPVAAQDEAARLVQVAPWVARPAGPRAAVAAAPRCRARAAARHPRWRRAAAPQHQDELHHDHEQRQKPTVPSLVSRQLRQHQTVPLGHGLPLDEWQRESGLRLQDRGDIVLHDPKPVLRALEPGQQTVPFSLLPTDSMRDGPSPMARI